MNRFEMLDKLLNHFTPEKLLDELVRGMSDDEMRSSYEHIIRVWGYNQDEELIKL